MQGNVWQWVEDCWQEDYEGAPKNGASWNTACTPDDRRRVERGGSWNSNPDLLRSASRDWYAAGNRDYSLGFRVGRTLSP
jgi:formylglycine-generating enzyme required for sulfatase activity